MFLIRLMHLKEMKQKNTSEIVLKSFEKNPNLNWCIGQNKIINDRNNFFDQILNNSFFEN